MYEPVGLRICPFESTDKVLRAHDDGMFCRAHDEVFSQSVLGCCLFEAVAEAHEIRFNEHILLRFSESISVFEGFLRSIG